LAVIFVLTIRGAEYLAYAVRAVRFPFELEYAEGLVWQQALWMLSPRMYGDITRFPFIVFQYTPVYYLAIRAIAALGVDPLAVGRGITLTAAIATAVLAGTIAAAAVREIVPISARVVGAVISGLMVFTYHPVQEWAVFMRVDMLAIAFNIAGVYLFIIGEQNIVVLCGAILMFVLAVYTKQTEITGPIAAVLVALVIDVRSTLWAVAFGLLVGGSAFAILELTTDGRFWHHIVDYNIYDQFSWRHVLDVGLAEKTAVPGVLLGLAAFAFLWCTEASPLLAGTIASRIDALRRSRKLRALAIISVWFGLASVQLISLGKRGAWSNYFIEWMCITTVPVGMVASLAWDRTTAAEKTAAVRGLAGLVLSLVLAIIALYRPLFESPLVGDPKAIALRAHLVNLIRQNPKPSLSEDMVLLVRAGQEIPIEPAEFAGLTRAGVWDQRPFLNLIEQHAFGLIIMNDYQIGRFTRKVMTAIQENYPLKDHVGNYIIRRPRGQVD